MRPLPPAKRYETSSIALPTETGVVVEVLLTYVPAVGADATEIKEMVTTEGEVNMRVPLEDVDMLCAALLEAKAQAEHTDDQPSSLAESRTTDV